MRHAGQTVTRTMLLEGVWKYRFEPETKIIDVQMSRLRQKIERGFETAAYPYGARIRILHLCGLAFARKPPHITPQSGLFCTPGRAVLKTEKASGDGERHRLPSRPLIGRAGPKQQV